MGHTLDRYLLSECLPAFGLTLAVLTFVLLMHRLLKLTDLVVAKGVPFSDVMKLLGLALPALLALIIPVALFLAVILAVGRLSSDSEIVVMRACGVGLGQNLRPTMALSATIFAVTAVVSLWIQPAAARSFKRFLYESVKSRIGVTTETGVFTELAEGVTVYAERMDRPSGAMANLFIELDRGATRGMWILAQTGTLRGETGALVLDLRDGEIHQHAGPEAPYRRARFEEYQLRVPLPGASWAPDVDEMPTRALLAGSFSDKDEREARLELHRRLALPTSCLVLGLLGTALGMHHFRGGRSRGLALSLAVLLVYYALFTAGKALGKRGTMPPELTMWTPNLVLLFLGAYAFARKNREAPFPLEEALGRWVRRLRRVWRRESLP